MVDLEKDSKIVEKLKSIIKSINSELDVTNLQKLNLIEDLGFTSFDMLILTVEIENEFGIELISEDLYQLNPISKLITKISDNIA